jgi:hypothetical protein
MASALLIAVAILATLIFVLFCALLELFQDVRQMRDALAILDRPAPIDIGRVAGTAPSAYGLPPQLDAAKGALLLFLSDKCSTCRVLAATIGGSMAAGLWIVVEASSPHAAELFVENYGLAQGIEDHRVIIDPAGTIAGQLRLNTTPVAYRIENGLFTDAMTVPSVRNLVSLIPSPAEDAINYSPSKRKPSRLAVLNLIPSGALSWMASWENKRVHTDR